MFAGLSKKTITILTILCIMVLVIAMVIQLSGCAPKSRLPKLEVSNGSEVINATQGTFIWQTSGSLEIADSMGPLGLYKLGELKQIAPGDEGSLSLRFDSIPKSISIDIYPESSAAKEDYSSKKSRYASTELADFTFTVPKDGTYIIDVHGEWNEGKCDYYFYSSP